MPKNKGKETTPSPGSQKTKVTGEVDKETIRELHKLFQEVLKAADKFPALAEAAVVALCNKLVDMFGRTFTRTAFNELLKQANIPITPGREAIHAYVYGRYAGGGTAIITHTDESGEIYVVLAQHKVRRKEQLRFPEGFADPGPLKGGEDGSHTIPRELMDEEVEPKEIDDATRGQGYIAVHEKYQKRHELLNKLTFENYQKLCVSDPELMEEINTIKIENVESPTFEQKCQALVEKYKVIVNSFLSTKRVEIPKTEWDIDFKDCAIREAREEVGVILNKDSPSYLVHYNGSYNENRKFSLFAHIYHFSLKEKCKLKPDSTEISKALWVPVSKIKYVSEESAYKYDDSVIPPEHMNPLIKAIGMQVDRDIAEVSEKLIGGREGLKTYSTLLGFEQKFEEASKDLLSVENRLYLINAAKQATKQIKANLSGKKLEVSSASVGLSSSGMFAPKPTTTKGSVTEPTSSSSSVSLTPTLAPGTSPG